MCPFFKVVSTPGRKDPFSCICEPNILNSWLQKTDLIHASNTSIFSFRTELYVADLLGVSYINGTAVYRI